MNSTKKGHLFQLLTLCFMITTSLLLGVIFSYLGYEPNIVISILLSQYGIFGIVIIAYMLITKSPIKRTFIFKKLPIKEALICLLIAWFISPLLAFINVVSQFFVTNQISSSMMDMLSLPVFVTLILVAATPAFFEEIIARTLIIDNYKKHSVLIVCVLSGLFFGFLHLNFNQFFYALAMGMIMCYVVMVTESIFSSMIIHFTINGTNVLLLYVMFGDKGLFSSTDMITQTTETTVPQLLLSSILILFFVGVFTPLAILLINELLRRHNKTFKGSLKMSAEDFMGRSETMPDTADESSLSGKRIITPIYIITALLFFTFALLTELMM